ncbi:MAG TPA: MmcQ/YjbR family DNA-binding protein [Terriglobales bacterium]|nr:MmcQ/YjbR family DNA-binding protein [Terriglobales bacterium]
MHEVKIGANAPIAYDTYRTKVRQGAGTRGGNMAVTFESVRRMALALEKVEEGTSYGTPAFKVGGALIARLREDLDSLVVRSDFDERAELMAADPEAYYITEHYLNYEWVLVRLGRVHPDAMRDLLRGAWRRAAPSGRKTPRKRKGAARKR